MASRALAWGLVLASVCCSLVEGLATSSEGSGVAIQLVGRLSRPLEELGGVRHVGQLVPVAGVGSSARPVQLTVDGLGRFEVVLRGAVAWRLELRAEGFLPLDRWIAPLPQRQTIGPVPLIRAELESLRLERAQAHPDPRGDHIENWVVEEQSILPTVHRDALRAGGWSRTLRSGWAEGAGGAEEGDASWTFVRAAGEQLVLRAASRWGASRVAIGPREGAGAVEQAPFARRRALALELVDGAGRPVSAEVSVDSFPVGRTDAQGRIGLKIGLREDGEAAVVDVRSSAGTLRWRPEARELEKGAVRKVVATAGASRGVVRAADGRALSGAWVIVGDQAVRTDVGGRYVLEGPSEEHAQSAWVGLAGYVPFESQQLPSDVVLLRAQMLVGEVVGPGGTRLQDVQITAVPAAAGGVGRFAFSDEAGRFRFVQLPADRLVEVVAQRLDRPQRLWPPVRMQVTTPEPGTEMPPLQVVLRPVRPAEGWVVDSADRPIEGARVVLEESEPMGLERRRLSAVTDTGGRWVVNDLPFQRLQLYARASGHAPGYEREVEIPRVGEAPAGRPVAVGTLVLEPEATLRLRILDADGEPAVGALVRHYGSSPRVRPAADAVPAISRGPSSSAADIEGAVVLGELVDGERVSIEIRHAGHVEGRLRDVRVPAEGPIEVRLERAGIVAGRCLTSTGRPLEDARVSVRSANRAVSLPGDLSARCDEAGRFEISGVPAGSVVVWGRAYGLPDFVEVPLEITAGERVVGVDLRVPPSGAVNGWVRSSGRAVAGATVRCCALPSVKTDETGWFELAGATEGTHRIEAESMEFGVGEAEVTVNEGREARIELELNQLLTLEGRVVDSKGEARAGVLVWLSRDRPSSEPPRASRTTTDERGLFRFVGLRPGLVRLFLRHGRETGRSRDVEFELTEQERFVEILFGGTAVIRGRVTGLVDHELSQVRVSARTEEGSVSSQVSADGTFELDDLPAGLATVRAGLARPRREKQRTVQLEDGGVHDVVLDFDDEELVALEVRLPATSRILAQQGLALSAAIVTEASGVAQQGSYASFDASGRAQFQQREAGAWHVSVSAQGTVLAPVWSGRVDRDRTLELALEKVRVTGVALRSDGSPLVGRYLAVASQSAERIVQRSWIPLDEEGRFDFQAVVNGAYRIVLLPERSAPAGAEPLLLAELFGAQSGLVLTVP